MGIEPTSEAWEASILPLNYARDYLYYLSIILLILILISVLFPAFMSTFCRLFSNPMQVCP